MKKRIIKVVVACSNSNGEPDFFFVKVRATQKEMDNGDHYLSAERYASEIEGYENPMVSYDQYDRGTKAFFKLFLWKTASIIHACI